MSSGLMEDHRPPSLALGGPPASEWRLDDVLANRRWLSRRKPFPHVVARGVFVPEVYRLIIEAFRAHLGAMSLEYAEQHDFIGGPLTADAPEPLRFFLSETWHEPFIRMFGFEPVDHVSAGIHRHRPGGRNGFPHNDIKTEQIPITAAAGGGGECVRAAAILFYLNNGAWSIGDGGGTGLYRHWSDPVEAPESIVPPLDNSLLAFACSPYSYHSFMSNKHRRDSIVLFLYRSLESYLDQWGTEGLSQYADG